MYERVRRRFGRFDCSMFVCTRSTNYLGMREQNGLVMDQTVVYEPQQVVGRKGCKQVHVDRNAGTFQGPVNRLPREVSRSFNITQVCINIEADTNTNAPNQHERWRRAIRKLGYLFSSISYTHQQQDTLILYKTISTYI